MGRIVELFKNNPVPLNQLESIKIFTKHCDGISCDNWNLNGLTVKARGGFPDKIIFNHSDNPLFRFTGSEFTTSFSFDIMKNPCGGRSVRPVDKGGNVIRHVPGGNIPNK